MDKEVMFLRALNTFRAQASEVWSFLSSLVSHHWVGGVRTIDKYALLDVEYKELPVNPSELELSWLRLCEAIALSYKDNKWEWHDVLCEAYLYVNTGSFGEYRDIPTMIQAREAEKRLEGIGTLSEVCLSLERVATFGDWLDLDVRELYTQEADKIRAKTEAKEALALYREVAPELLEAQCTKSAIQEQASAPEVAGLQARISELEQALEASEVKCKELAEQLDAITENEADSASEVVRRVLMSKGLQGVKRLFWVLDKAKDRGIITEVAGRLQWGSNTIVTNAQCAYMVASLNEKFYPKGKICWSDWCSLIGGLQADKLRNSHYQRKAHAINIEGRDTIDALFDD